MPDTVTLSINGRPIEVGEGSMVSTAIAAAGYHWCRRSITGEPRAPVCGMGICFECRVSIDGKAHERSCQVLCASGMKVETDEVVRDRGFSQTDMKAPTRVRREFDVAIIGAGPAGLASAWAAAQSGASVAIIDDNQSKGGQIWRGDARSPKSSEAAEWFDRIRDAKLELLSATRVFDLPSPDEIVAETPTGTLEIGYRSLIVAAGARERLLPFPGWTLPNVCGAGGLQALIKSGLPIEGKRVVVAGTGPLLLAVADFLKKRGARVCLIADQTSRAKLARFGLGLLSSPAKLKQSFGLLRRLKGIRVQHGCWVTEASGDGKLERVVVSKGESTTVVDCDYLALGFHLVPNIEVATLAGCEIKDGKVVTDDFQRTSVRNIFSAGESTGIGGLELALVEGQIAGHAATGREDRARHHFPERAQHRKFADLLNRNFVLREELKGLVRDETIVCRCEDVNWGELKEHSSWRAAKLHTRCGMGPCQGRTCGPAVSFLLGWNLESVRPPVFPVRIDSLTPSGSQSKVT